ncbi:MAG: hypothetical protein WA584_02045 [Pyrinomonadaceae bacterium]
MSKEKSESEALGEPGNRQKLTKKTRNAATKHQTATETTANEPRYDVPFGRTPDQENPKFKNFAASFHIVFTVLLFAFSTIAVMSQRVIINLSTEDPAFPNNTNIHQAEGTMPGWLTAHPVQPGVCSGADCRPIERWSTGFMVFYRQRGQVFAG